MEERTNIIHNCYSKVAEGGSMVFVTLSTKDTKFDEGLEISTNRFLSKHDVKLYFHHNSSIEEEFGAFGFAEA
ncbi:hypothetical protein [Fulvivirga sediminis]|uniref:Uncharacterized protein n=1 Tax=Fulvivirga sediminis TaxID=2803949 RepID=A0A937FB15_9BACT|nr:hypothetical protein [Fulvivirga sediminis]MBL3658940.1 hypothetical protein [Fulvivirga sediminis]